MKERIDENHSWVTDDGVVHSSQTSVFPENSGEQGDAVTQLQKELQDKTGRDRDTCSGAEAIVHGLSILSQNIYRGLCDKLKSNEFVSIISVCDIICLCETWSSINDCFSLQGYEQINIPREVKGACFPFLQASPGSNFQFK